MEGLAVHIHEFVPDADGPELTSRIALLRARDHAAMMRGQVTDDDAFDLACQAHEVAGAWVYADATADQLTIAASLARNLVQAAFSAEFLSTGKALQ